MAIKEAVSEYDFTQRFITIGRGDQFSYQALKALFEYLEELSEDTGQDIEFDPIAICCEFNECDAVATFSREYLNVEGEAQAMDEECDDDEERLEWVREYLEERTSVVKCEGGMILFAAF